MIVKKKSNGVVGILNFVADLISDLASSVPVKNKLSFKDITRMLSGSIDQLIAETEQKEVGAKFGSGRFYITELNNTSFKTSVLMYFVTAEGQPCFELKREGPVFKISRLNVESISELRNKHELSFKITAP